MRFVPAIAVVSVLGFGCGGRIEPPAGPGKKPHSGTVSKRNKRLIKRPAAREVLIGEMCPTAAAGRAAVIPVFVRRIGWNHQPDELIRPLQRRAARQFSVLGWDGARAGLFNVAGLANLGAGRSVAVGAYAGSSPCKLTAKGIRGTGAVNKTCVAAQDHCGVAIAVLEKGSGFGSRPFEEDPDPTDWKVGGACVADGKLLVDIDGDGEAEAYPVNQFLNSVRQPSDEVTAVPRGGSKCEPAFANRNVLPGTDPKHWRGLDVLAVLDMDGDGRAELLVTYHYSDRRTWAIYSSTSTPARLELMGESTPFPRP